MLNTAQKTKSSWSLKRMIIGAGIFLVACVVLYYFLAILGALIPSKPHNNLRVSTQQTPVTFHMVPGAIHYDLILPANDETRNALKGLKASGLDSSNSAIGHFIIGWGAIDYHAQAKDRSSFSPVPLLRSLTGDASILRVQPLAPLESYDGMVSLSLPAGDYAAMLSHIETSFNQDAAGAIINMVPEQTKGQSWFFEGSQQYSVFYTGNDWVSDVLAAGGMRLGVWTPTPRALLTSLRYFGHLDSAS